MTSRRRCDWDVRAERVRFAYASLTVWKITIFKSTHAHQQFNCCSVIALECSRNKRIVCSWNFQNLTNRLHQFFLVTSGKGLLSCSLIPDSICTRHYASLLFGLDDQGRSATVRERLTRRNFRRNVHYNFLNMIRVAWCDSHRISCLKVCSPRTYSVRNEIQPEDFRRLLGLSISTCRPLKASSEIMSAYGWWT